MTKTRLCLVRHGETDWNVERRLQGHLDVPLNAIGHEQARAAGESLRALSFDVLYSSDLLRTRQTTEAIARALGMPFNLTAGLRERHYGGLQGLTHSEAKVQRPQDYHVMEQRDVDTPFSEGGESLRDFAGRVGQTLHQLAHQHRGETLLLVTHGGVLDAVNRYVRQLPLHTARDFVIPNAALNWIVCEHHADERCNWTIEAWADRSHLETARDEIT